MVDALLSSTKSSSIYSPKSFANRIRSTYPEISTGRTKEFRSIDGGLSGAPLMGKATDKLSYIYTRSNHLPSYLGSSNQYQFSNGKIPVVMTWSYSLKPKKIGIITIPPFKIEYNNEILSTKPHKLQIN